MARCRAYCRGIWLGEHGKGSSMPHTIGKESVCAAPTALPMVEARGARGVGVSPCGNVMGSHTCCSIRPSQVRVRRMMKKRARKLISNYFLWVCTNIARNGLLCDLLIASWGVLEVGSNLPDNYSNARLLVFFCMPTCGQTQDEICSHASLTRRMAVVFAANHRKANRLT